MGAVWVRATVIGCLAVLLPLPASAADWGSYENGRYGYVVDVPPGFTSNGESDNGDGQVFTGPGGATLTVFGANVVEDDFAAEIASREAFDREDGWRITYENGGARWASYSGKRDDRILYQRAIALCDGTQFAAFALEYPQADKAEFDPVVAHLVKNFAASGNGAC